MASLFDIIAFFLTMGVFVGAILGVKYASEQISTSVKSAKDSLRDRGLTISDKGLSVRTSARYSREDYVDATQRGFMKAMSASSFSTADNAGNASGNGMDSVAGMDLGGGRRRSSNSVVDTNSNNNNYNNNNNNNTAAEGGRRNTLGVGNRSSSNTSVPGLERRVSEASVVTNGSSDRERERGGEKEKKKSRFGLRKKNSV